MASELSQLAREIENRGYKILKARRRSHLHVLDLEGRLVSVLSSSSSDWHMRKNALADIRRFEQRRASLKS